MIRTLEPELMEDVEQALAYAEADFSESNQRFADRLIENYSEHMQSVLDIGCGSADIPIRLARLAPSVQITAIDGSEAMLNLARKGIAESGNGDRITVTRAYVPQLPFRDHSFDTIISNSLLHHLPDPSVFWREVIRLGNDRAVIFVMDLFRPDSPEAAAKIVEEAGAGEHPVLKTDFYNSLLAAFAVEEVQQQLVDAGLSQLQLNVVSDRHWLVSGRLSTALSVASHK